VRITLAIVLQAYVLKECSIVLRTMRSAAAIGVVVFEATSRPRSSRSVPRQLVPLSLLLLSSELVTNHAFMLLFGTSTFSRSGSEAGHVKLETLVLFVVYAHRVILCSHTICGFSQCECALRRPIITVQ
jgi:hypothetical protein